MKQRTYTARAQFQKRFLLCFFEPHILIFIGHCRLFPRIVRYNAATSNPASIADGKRMLVVTLASRDTGLNALQEISIQVSFISAQNPLLPDGYSNLQTYSVFTEERPSLLAKNYRPMNRARHWCRFFFPCSCFTQASDVGYPLRLTVCYVSL